MSSMAKVKPDPGICIGIEPSGLVVVGAASGSETDNEATALQRLRRSATSMQASTAKLDRRLRLQERAHLRVERWLRAIYRLPVVRLAMMPLLWLLKRRWRSSRNSALRLASQIRSCRTPVLFYLTPAVVAAYEELASRFGKLAEVDRAWLIDLPDGWHGNFDKLTPGGGLKRDRCRLRIGTHPHLRADGLGLIIESELRQCCFFPLFGIAQGGAGETNIVALTDIEITAVDVIYLEEETPSSESAVISYSTKPGNRSGKNAARQLPFLSYGALHVVLPGSDQFALMTSSAAVAREFADCFKEYVAALRALATSAESEQKSLFEGHHDDDEAPLGQLASKPAVTPSGFGLPMLDLSILALLGAALWALHQQYDGWALRQSITERLSMLTTIVEGHLYPSRETNSSLPHDQDLHSERIDTPTAEESTIQNRSEDNLPDDELPEMLEAEKLEDLIIIAPD